MKSIHIIAVSLGALSALLLTGCGKSANAKAAGPKEAPLREVQVAKAEVRPMERVLRVVGTLAARNEATIAAQVAGQLEKNHVDVGDRVKAGQELALIDTTSYEALARASAANLARAQASAENAAQNLKRIQDLQKDKIASSSELDTAVAEAGRTRAEVKAAEANDAVVRLNLERSRVKAPFDAAVAERLAAAGDYLAIGTPILQLVQTDPLRLRLEVPERESVAVQVGQAVRVTVEYDTNIYSGTLARIAPAIRESNRMLLVEADVPNKGGLHAGLFARAEIIVNSHDEVVSVPEKALITFAGLEKVVTVNEGKASEKTVVTGRRAGGAVEITAGLNVGETVVLNPAGIRTGQALAVVNKPETRTATNAQPSQSSALP
jgi:RND family efflux transporter MFP subunit